MRKEKLSIATVSLGRHINKEGEFDSTEKLVFFKGKPSKKVLLRKVFKQQSNNGAGSIKWDPEESKVIRFIKEGETIVFKGEIILLM